MNVGIPPIAGFYDARFGRKFHDFGRFGRDDFGFKVEFALVAVVDANGVGAKGFVGNISGLVAGFFGGSVGVDSDAITGWTVGGHGDSFSGEDLVGFTDKVDGHSGGEIGFLLRTSGFEFDDRLGEGKHFSGDLERVINGNG